MDKTGNLHVPIGKVSFTEDQLADNMAASMAAVMKAKPASAKGVYLKKVVVTADHGPGRAGGSRTPAAAARRR